MMFVHPGDRTVAIGKGAEPVLDQFDHLGAVGEAAGVSAEQPLAVLGARCNGLWPGSPSRKPIPKTSSQEIKISS